MCSDASVELGVKRPQSERPVEVVRSKKRRKSVSAELKNGTLIVRAPAQISDRELKPIIDKLQKRLAKRTQRDPQSDEELEKRARHFNRKLFDGKLKWQSIRYVSNQNKRYGSCTPATGTIRISDRLATMPTWVRDYVIVHELAHLLEPNHGANFWALCNRYPLTERARGYLMACDLEQEDTEGTGNGEG